VAVAGLSKTTAVQAAGREVDHWGAAGSAAGKVREREKECWPERCSPFCVVPQASGRQPINGLFQHKVAAPVAAPRLASNSRGQLTDSSTRQGRGGRMWQDKPTT
jgi:hypothetical protein